MGQRTIIPAATAAQATPQPFDTAKFVSVVISANLLAGGEEVDVFVLSNASYVVLTDQAGTVVKLTASKPSWTVLGGPRYAVTKDTTVGACGVYVWENRKAP